MMSNLTEVFNRSYVETYDIQLIVKRSYMPNNFNINAFSIKQRFIISTHLIKQHTN